MIKSDKGSIHIEGTGHELLADLSCSVKAIYDSFIGQGLSKKEAEETILKAVNHGINFKEVDISDMVCDFIKLLLGEK